MNDLYTFLETCEFVVIVLLLYALHTDATNTFMHISQKIHSFFSTFLKL